MCSDDAFLICLQYFAGFSRSTLFKKCYEYVHQRNDVCSSEMLFSDTRFHIFQRNVLKFAFLFSSLEQRSFVETFSLNSDVSKMFGQRDCILAVVVTYLVLIILLFAYKKPDLSRNRCLPKSACVRFCCDNSKTCSQKFVDEHFNKSLIPGFANGYFDVKFLYGRPDCPTLKRVEAHHSWEFSHVRLKN